MCIKLKKKRCNEDLSNNQDGSLKGLMHIGGFKNIVAIVDCLPP